LDDQAFAVVQAQSLVTHDFGDTELRRLREAQQLLLRVAQLLAERTEPKPGATKVKTPPRFQICGIFEFCHEMGFFFKFSSMFFKICPTTPS
jgi:hypothetical protein